MNEIIALTMKQVRGQWRLEFMVAGSVGPMKLLLSEKSRLELIRDCRSADGMPPPDDDEPTPPRRATG